MIFNPAIIALLGGSLLLSVMLLYSCWFGALILKNWDIRSGSERQLDLERRTYLISTIMSYGLGFQLISLFLFVYTADSLSSLFVGAMCAAGSLHVDPWGYPTILMKVLNFLVAGVWLILNHADNTAHDYPLIRKKYEFLMVAAPLVLVETAMQAAYFLGLRPAIITSCCGTLFTSEAEGVAAGIVALPQGPVELAFYACMAATLGLGIWFYRTGKGGYLFAGLSFINFLVSAVALISFISLYFYELPTHHCPFCVLHSEYHYVGYLLYVSFLGGAVTGLGVGALAPFTKVPSLAETLPRIQRRLAMASVVGYVVFLLVVGIGILTSNLVMSS